MSAPGIMLQIAGKWINCYYIGSQLTVDYQSNFIHIFNLEDFTAKVIIGTKQSYDWCLHNNGNWLKKIRSNNSYFSNIAFLEQVYSSNQAIKFYEFIAYH